MPGDSNTPHPTTPRTIDFHEAEHTYIDDTGQHYTSVTALISKYAQPFDAETIAQRKAEREVDRELAESCVHLSDANWREAVRARKDALRASWDQKRDSASDYGTRVHETAEKLILGHAPPHQPRDDRERHAFSLVWEQIQHMQRCEVWMHPELVVFSPRTGLAGSIDLLSYQDGILYLSDWKTNGEINGEGFRGAMMRHPVADVPDGNFSHYRLQLAIYLWILQNEGYERFLPGPVEAVTTNLLWVPPVGCQPSDGLQVIETHSDSIASRAYALAMILDHLTDLPF